MKKLLAVIVVALVAATTVSVILRVQLAKRLATVPELLPGTTLALVEVPDFQRARTQWHRSDLYQIWREPTVQTWLRQPLARLPEDGGRRQILEDFLRLGPTHGFVAVTSLENNEPKLIAGFHFDKSTEEARTFVEQRKAEWLNKNGEAKRETAAYEQHQIETVSVSHFVFASVCDNHWFFAANDLATLKTLLDRVDRRGEKAASLQANKVFIDATVHLPNDYAASLFVDPRPFVEKLIPLVAMTGQSFPIDQLNRLKQVRTVATSFSFDHGKMSETDFVAMPRMSAEEKLERRLLGVAGANTFFYSTACIPWSESVFPSPSGALGLPAALQQLTAALKARGIAENDLREAFGTQFEIVGDWPADSRWPALQATLPVKDPARARKIAEALTSVEIAGMPWIRSEKDGATFYSAQPSLGIVPLHLAVAVSDQMMLAGTDAAAIESTLTRIAAPADELEKSVIFRDASKLVPAGESAFNYVDTRLLFERADAALRPLLLMGAAFSPALGKNVDPAKLPPSEAIAKHLSPIVMAQRYEKEGYVTESLGPVTFRAATVSLVGAIAGVFVSLQDQFKGGLLPAGPANSLPAAGATASPLPSASPF